MCKSSILQRVTQVAVSLLVSDVVRSDDVRRSPLPTSLRQARPPPPTLPPLGDESSPRRIEDGGRFVRTPHWLPVRWRVRFKLCCVMHSVFHGTCPAYLSNIVEPVGAGRTRPRLRCTTTTDFSLPRLRTKFGERSFSHVGPSAWNDLPEDLRAVADSAKFRQQLKTYFFTRAFNAQ